MQRSQDGSFFLSRNWQTRGLVVLVPFSICLGFLGIYTLHISPLLRYNSRILDSLSEPIVTSIDGINLDSTFFLRLPEFFTPSAETQWWSQQEKIYKTLRKNDAVHVVLTERNGVITQDQVAVDFMSFFDGFKRTWLIYLVALLYLIYAIVVFQRHRSPPGIVLTYFFLACALYFICSAPLVNRPLTLQPFIFKFLTTILYISAGGLITLAHFALVFPEPKILLKKYPWSLNVLYGYFLLSVALYLAGITAFGTTFPLFCFWILVIVVPFSILSLRRPIPS